jgi:ribonuclease R
LSSKPKKPAPLPTKQQIVEFIAGGGGRVGKREIARAFGISGANRIWLKRTLKELETEGEVERGRSRRLARKGVLPEMALIDVTGTNIDGELEGKPAEWRDDSPPPKVVLAEAPAGMGAVGVGDRVLARLKPISAGLYEGRPIRRVDVRASDVVGLFTRVGRDGRIVPTDRKLKFELSVAAADAGGAASGELVHAEILPGEPYGLRRARVIARLGSANDPRSLSLIAIHTHGIPDKFPPDALAEAEAAVPVRAGKREDLRSLLLLTIDPADARDRDDAVWAEPDTDAANPGGWHVIVAIADVSHYVRPGGALDREARKRGNSTYFPDRVVPMLPDTLSGDLCSLHANAPRPCLAAHMWFDAEGNKLRHRFARALMRSAGALEYGQVQRAFDGHPDDACGQLLDTAIRPLYSAYAALRRARDKRQPLDLDLPERQVEFGPDGRITGYHPRPRYDAHKLIEEFMIAANVAAAEALEACKQPCVYRVHAEPSRERVDALRDFLDSLDYRLAKGQVLQPRLFNAILARAKDTPHMHLVNQVVLRAQAQAEYAVANIGHFGLALRRYAHFTSPIRRYADLLVHRALVKGLGLGPGGMGADEAGGLADTAAHISMTERRSMTAERDALDRFAAAFMADRVGAVFAGRIDGVTRFGLFVQLAESGASGLVPMRALGDDFFVHDERQHALVGRKTGQTFRLGEPVDVRLAEADAVTGSLRFELVGRGAAAPPSRPGGHRRGFMRTRTR